MRITNTQAQELGVKCEVLTAKLVDCEERLEMSSALLKQKVCNVQVG